MSISVVSRGLYPPANPVGYTVGFQLSRPGRAPIYVDTTVALAPSLTGATPSETEHNYIAAAREQLSEQIDAYFSQNDPEAHLLPQVSMTPQHHAADGMVVGRRVHLEDDGKQNPLLVPRWRCGDDLSIGTFLPKPWRCNVRRRQFLATEADGPAS